ncbi:hypothetical protein MN608_01880 [Microdochium nivale]|nr:hypothetical protein MN608_01880 [Microdochium nivale]
MASTNAHGPDAQQQQPPLAAYHDDPEEDSSLANLLPGEADDVLPSHSSPARDDKSAMSWLSRLGLIATVYLPTAICFLVGAFFATCPSPRHWHWAQYPTRQILVIILVILVVIPPSLRRRSASFSSSFGLGGRARRVLASYAGMAVALYALIFTSDDVHIEFRWDSLLWYSTYGGPQLGYLTRTLLAYAGFAVHRAARLHTTPRILAAYALSVLGVYVDVPMTLIDLAKGRPKW